MRRFFNDVLMKRRSNQMIVKKTDDEITRYVKQNQIIETRNTFEKNFQRDLKSKEQH